MSRLHYPATQRQPIRVRLKSIFEDDATVIAKGHEYYHMYQEWQNKRAGGQIVEPLFKADVATKLEISEEDAAALMEFCHSNHGQDFGQFELEYIRSQSPIFLDLDGDEKSTSPDPFGF